MTWRLDHGVASGTTVPVGSIIILIVVAATAGLVAVWLAARRAGRLNVLDAIAQ
jgi:ABC-type antimicrobial peptide transport system permease subunit